MRRSYDETIRARAYIARCVAAMLEDCHENSFVLQDEHGNELSPNEPKAIRQKKALVRLHEMLRKQGTV